MIFYVKDVKITNSPLFNNIDGRIDVLLLMLNCFFFEKFYIKGGLSVQKKLRMLLYSRFFL
jgi:hypothetical protein